jgi:2-polyprenyl-3-methyl-5-hydroxy-6-metoxy-1,4-benzoquinol methylase
MIICPVCKGESKKFLKIKNFEIFRCKSCRVLFLYPFPEKIEEIYNDDYFKKWYLKFYGERKKYLENLWEKIKRYAPKKGKVLDIGCGVGIWLEVLKEKGFEVCGQDISNFAVDFCKKKRIYIYNQNLTEIDLPENTFDLITMFDVIAHLKTPLEYLKKCKKILKKEGTIIIKTPLHSNFLFFVAKILSFIKKSKSILHIPAQIYHFDKNSISNLARIGDLKVVKIMLINEFVNKKISFLNIWKFFMEKSMIVILKNE